MNESTINLLMQIPLAGLVVLVVYMFLKYIKSNAEAWREAIAKENDMTRSFMREERERSTEAYRVQNETTCAALNNLIKAVADTNESVRANNMLVTAHDRNTMEAVMNISQIWAKLNNADQPKPKRSN